MQDQVLLNELKELQKEYDEKGVEILKFEIK